MREIHRGPVNSPHKCPVTRKMFPFDDVIMVCHHQMSVGCSDLQANIQCSGCSQLGGKSLWNRTILRDYHESGMSTTSRMGLCFPQWHHNILAAIANLLISDIVLWLMLLAFSIRLEGPEDPHPRSSWFRRSRDPAHASIPRAQTPWGLTGRAWLQSGVQRVVIVGFPPLNSIGIDSRNAI